MKLLDISPHWGQPWAHREHLVGPRRVEVIKITRLIAVISCLWEIVEKTTPDFEDAQ